MLFTLYVNDQQKAHRLTLDGAKDAAVIFISKGESVRIEHRARDADKTTWHYDPVLSDWCTA
jgi:hypothetical protein